MSRSIRLAIGGWVEKRLARLAPLSRGATINRWAVEGEAGKGKRREGRRGASSSGSQRPAQPLDRKRRRRRDDRRVGDVSRDVPVAHMRELVRDDDPDLVAAVAVEQGVEQHHLVGPRPVTYALAAVVRRLASTEYTSPTRTPAARASSSTSERVPPSGSGVKSLNTGSSRTGASAVSAAPTAIEPAPAGSHQPRG